MQQTIKLGNLTLPRTAGLAPMAGVADRAYRILCKEHQAALLVSEMISAKGLCYGDPKTAQFCTITDAERPMGLQLFGLFEQRRKALLPLLLIRSAALSAGLD